jgi:UDP-glucose 4-epimerase
MENIERKIFRTNVAVIGGAGFLGSHLVNHLVEDRECNVIVLDNLITGIKDFVHPKAKFIYCDITIYVNYYSHITI